jgi:hypothetical protein
LARVVLLVAIMALIQCLAEQIHPARVSLIQQQAAEPVVGILAERVMAALEGQAAAALMNGVLVR